MREDISKVIDVDDDCPNMTDEQLKVMSLVLSHKGTRGGSRKAFFYQGLEQERLNSIRNLMDSMNLSLRQALEALKIPPSEHKKYQAVLF